MGIVVDAVRKAVPERFFRDGRLVALPRRRVDRREVLELLAANFEPGQRYREARVDTVLMGFHPDYCALRRCLVEEELLERREGFYWRCGGRFEVD